MTGRDRRRRPSQLSVVDRGSSEVDGQSEILDSSADTMPAGGATCTTMRSLVRGGEGQASRDGRPRYLVFY